MTPVSRASSGPVPARRDKRRAASARRRVPVIPCGVAVVRRGREFLIAQRQADDTFGSYWEFPGGRKNPGERFEDCVVREAREELGIEIAVERPLLQVRRRFHRRLIWLNFYLCRLVSGQPRPLESQRAEWVDVDRLEGFAFPPANERVIRKLKELCRR